MSELLVCPFCGGDAKTQDGRYGYFLWVGCSNAQCGMRPSSQFHSEAEAVAAWNRRPAESSASPAPIFPPHEDKPDAKSGLSFCTRCGVAKTRGRADFCSPTIGELSSRVGQGANAYTADRTETRDETNPSLPRGDASALREALSALTTAETLMMSAGWWRNAAGYLTDAALWIDRARTALSPLRGDGKEEGGGR